MYNPEVHNDHCKYGHTDGPKVRSGSQCVENKESTVTDSTATPAVTTFWRISYFKKQTTATLKLYHQCVVFFV